MIPCDLKLIRMSFLLDCRQMYHCLRLLGIDSSWKNLVFSSVIALNVLQTTNDQIKMNYVLTVNCISIHSRNWYLLTSSLEMTCTFWNGISLELSYSVVPSRQFEEFWATLHMQYLLLKKIKLCGSAEGRTNTKNQNG